MTSNMTMLGWVGRKSPGQVVAGECFRQAGALLLNADGNRFCNESGPADPLAAASAGCGSGVVSVCFLRVAGTEVDKRLWTWFDFAYV